eukprot:m.711648 g.711648  ORF g.711648 m.711648 type:complete len:413 (-) comp22953_c0_seq5:3761-4999(-)
MDLRVFTLFSVCTVAIPFEIATSEHASSDNVPLDIAERFRRQSHVPSSWMQAPPLPSAVGEVAAVIVNQSLYVFGEGSDFTFKYDLLRRTWSTSEPARPYPGHHHSIVAFDSKILLVGGFQDPCAVPTCIGQVQEYDTVSQTWSVKSPIPWRAEGSVVAVRIGTFVYACGGLMRPGHGLEGSNPSDCYAVDISSSVDEVWTRRANLLHGVDHAACATDGRKMYVFGGRHVGRNIVAPGMDYTQIYDPSTDSWSYGEPMPIPRGGMGAAVFVNGYFVIAGGETTSSASATIDGVYPQTMLYKPATRQWSSATRMPVAVHGSFPVVDPITGNVYFAGGGTTAGFSQSTHLQILSFQSSSAVPDSLQCSGPETWPMTDRCSMEGGSCACATGRMRYGRTCDDLFEYDIVYESRLR